MRRLHKTQLLDSYVQQRLQQEGREYRMRS